VSRVAAAAALAALVVAPAAAADSASSGQVRALAARAAHDPAALARLRRIDVVDGRRMPVGRTLRASGSELQRRLSVLAGAAPARTAPVDARGAASEILDERRFRGSSVPRPFHGVLQWLGDRLRDITRPVHGLGRHIPGGDAVVWAVIAGIVVLLAAIASQRVAARRGGRELERARSARRGEQDPGDLEREADAAERAGDIELALRLRFRAGLVRLGRAKVIPLRESVTTREVRRALRSGDFDELARTFDEVVYGGRAARRDDLDAARATWPRVLEAAQAR
jgi:hypothetical protein